MENERNKKDYFDDGEIDFSELARVVWVGPRRALISLAGLVLGSILAFLFLFGRHHFVVVSNKDGAKI